MMGQRWCVRVAQEFQFDAKTADEAMQTLYMLQDRVVPGLGVIDAHGSLAPIGRSQVEFEDE